MKYKPLYIGALLILGLWVLRCLAAGTMYYYGFIFVNIFLASIPLLIEPLFPIIKRQFTGLARKVSYGVIALLWLLFIPNAFYILTDFMHLNATVLVNMPGDTASHVVPYIRGDAVYLLDSLLILSATLFGGYAGGLALYHAYILFRQRFTKQYTTLLISFIILLSSIGIFIGRFGRWNSWDALYRPWTIVTDLGQQLTNPLLLQRFCIVILTCVIFHVLCLYCAGWIARRLR